MKMLSCDKKLMDNNSIFSDVEIKLLAHTHSILTNLEAETGVNPGWINNGGLFIANNKVSC
jgi:hypothetical protein